MHNNIYINN